MRMGTTAVRLAMMVVVVFVITFAFAVTLDFCAALDTRGGMRAQKLRSLLLGIQSCQRSPF